MLRVLKHSFFFFSNITILAQSAIAAFPFYLNKSGLAVNKALHSIFQRHNKPRLDASYYYLCMYNIKYLTFI